MTLNGPENHLLATPTEASETKMRPQRTPKRRNEPENAACGLRPRNAEAPRFHRPPPDPATSTEALETVERRCAACRNTPHEQDTDHRARPKPRATTGRVPTHARRSEQM
jgi:hypothetical protein